MGDGPEMRRIYAATMKAVVAPNANIRVADMVEFMALRDGADYMLVDEPMRRTSTALP